MSRKKSQSNIGKKFVLFVKPIDKDGVVVESECGWLKVDPEIELVFSYKEAMIFTEREKGHGSPEDWKSYFEEEHPDWNIVLPPKYLD